ncbi:GspH/FimT family pseudopilin [Undibacterium griseum]|uniref:Type II secretion system protein H n=1 Tax=Undibacterium griseum TaxID=2762295 RepID=A0ABR6YQ83_9BURK|nr:GspH/FimT family pseudopilin [Undibacterium griseum]MBC3886046.1 GspH/FimT family pseudopilin [Undibacterium griseum]
MKSVRRQQGFTLLELLVVLVIVGIMLGVVSFNAMPDQRQRLENDARRIALLMQLARDEAILRNLPVAFEADQSGYRFQIREDRIWLPLKDDLLRERNFELSPVKLQMEPVPFQTMPMRVVFGREPVDKPFILTLQSGDSSVRIRADGIGHFLVE